MKRNVFIGLVLLAGILPVLGAKQSSITQGAITWHFDKAYEAGQFANGDYWVVGPVTIDSISPSVVNDAYGLHHGWEVNPIVSGNQGFEQRALSFSAALIPALPYNAQPGMSIVKSISNKMGTNPNPPYEVVLTAAVLTVVNAVPPDSGKTLFRPPYVGTSKPYYSVDSMRTKLLPSLAPVTVTLTLASIVTGFQRVQLDHKGGAMGRYIHPFQNIPDYGADIGQRNGDALLRLMLNDPIEQKKPALIHFLQYGIDIYHMYLLGQRWPDGGGHRPGQKIVLAFTAVMLNDQAMMDSVKAMTAKEFLSEDKTVFWSSKANNGQGMVLVGLREREESYWGYLNGQGGNQNIRDPYGYIDGGNAPGAYQLCCLSQPWKGEALAVHLMPSLKPVFNNQYLLDYVDRWVNFGTWTSPDPCAKTDPGPNYTGNCIAGSGRFPQNHGTQTDGGNRKSDFQTAMWDAYRSSVSVRGQDPRQPVQPISTARLNPVSFTLPVTTRQVAFYSIQGALVKEYAVHDGRVDLRAAHLPNGAYWVTIKGRAGAQKVIIVR